MGHVTDAYLLFAQSRRLQDYADGEAVAAIAPGRPSVRDAENEHLSSAHDAREHSDVTMAAARTLLELARRDAEAAGHEFDTAALLQAWSAIAALDDGGAR